MINKGCIKLIWLICLAPMLSFGMDRMTALSMLETCDNDRMVGRAGEISRYQVLKAEWRRVSDSRDYTNPTLAKTVAERLLNERIQRFQSMNGRKPTDFEFYALWNAPAQAFEHRISRVVAERCQRFANLCSIKDVPLVAVKSSRPAGPVL